MTLFILILFYLNLNIFYCNNKCINNFMIYLNEINKRDILIIEINNYHGECIPGYIKYFNIIGYKNIDILITPELYNQTILDFNYFKYKIKYLIFPKQDIDLFISLGMCDLYKICLFNTIEVGKLKMREYLHSNHKFKSIIVLHNKYNLNKTLYNFNNIVVLKKFKDDLPFYEVNPHYFGEYDLHKKSKIINFITAGGYALNRKNFYLLINSINKLLKNNIVKFHVTIVGEGFEKLENSIKNNDLTKYLTFTGRISYSLMYKYISKSDFFLPLLDPNKQKRYLIEKTSGSFQLSYGFNIPMIIEKTFAKIYNFNVNNSIIYDKNENFDKKLIEAINMREEEYKKIKEGLKIKAREIEKNSLENLKIILSK